MAQPSPNHFYRGLEVHLSRDPVHLMMVDPCTPFYEISSYQIVRESVIKGIVNMAPELYPTKKVTYLENLA